MKLIEAENVTFAYFGKTVLENISMSVGKGEIVSLLGPNGSGKTTLLKVLLGIYLPRKGRVLLEGLPIRTLKPKEIAAKIAYVPQVHRLAFAYTVLDIVLMGRTPHKPFFSRYTKEDREISLYVMEKLSIFHLKDRYYTRISGGERQLTLIARSLAQGANILMMDEPESGLDYGNQIRLLERITELAEEGYTFIQSTHFPDHALWTASRVLMLREGKIAADGKPYDVINEDTISELYNISVNVLPFNEHLKVCIPAALGR